MDNRPSTQQDAVVKEENSMLGKREQMELLMLAYYKSMQQSHLKKTVQHTISIKNVKKWETHLLCLTTSKVQGSG